MNIIKLTNYKDESIFLIKEIFNNLQDLDFSYELKDTNWDISIGLISNNKLIGVYLLAIKQDPFKSLQGIGIQGVALGILKEFRGKGLSKTLINEVYNLEFDYIWGEHDKRLNNLHHWLKRRNLLRETDESFYTYVYKNKNYHKTKETQNPWIIQKTNESFQRSCVVSDIPYVIRKDGSKGCIWCGDDLKTKHPAQRYCKDKSCPISAYMWAYPQSNESCFFLLEKQKLKCNICSFDYSPYLKEILDPNFFNRQNIFNKIKTHEIPLEHRPEVDHIKAITQGGQSLGQNNHQVICYTCHKEKTKTDVKGPKRIKSSEELQEQEDKRLIKKFYEKLQPFMDIYYKDGTPIEESWKNYRELFLPSLSLKELQAKERTVLKEKPWNHRPDFKELEWVQEAIKNKINNG